MLLWKLNGGTNDHKVIKLICDVSYVIMSAMASQITGASIVYSTAYSGANQRKHQSSASLAFVQGIHRRPVNSPHKGPVMWKVFPFDDVIMWHSFVLSAEIWKMLHHTSWYVLCTPAATHSVGSCHLWLPCTDSKALKGLTLNTLRLRQNGRRFADGNFKCIFLNENIWISIKISLNYVPKGPINIIPTMGQIMAWCRLGNKQLSERMMFSLLTHICVTRLQWVNPWR